MNLHMIQRLVASFLVLFFLLLIIINFDEKYVVIPVIAIFSIVIITTLFLYIDNNIQKEYYEDIINNSTNIIVETDGKRLFSANKRFFNYTKVRTIEEFRSSYKCLCETFVNEEGYISKKMGELTWVEYIYKHPSEYHKVKLLLHDEIYYFSISASVSLKDSKAYIVVFSDITTQETYKIELEGLTVKDTLTNIGNRRVFEIKIKDLMIVSQRYNFVFSLIVFDIDFFKKVNDNHGHEVGDKVLIEYTSLIASCLRGGDEFCRIGGEEFAILVPNTTKDKAYILAQKLRKVVENHKHILPITMSFGVTQFIKGDDELSLYKRADEALYKAKESGRNKVMLG